MTVHAIARPPITADLPSLLRQARAKLPAALRRIGHAVVCYSGIEYSPLVARVARVEKYGCSLPAAQKLVDDLEAIAEAGDDAIIRMCGIGGVDLSGYNDAMRQHQADIAATGLRNAETRPRFSTTEFVAQLGARGITMTAVKGDLHITPAEKLTDADRAVLTAHKADFVAVVSAKVAVI